MCRRGSKPAAGKGNALPRITEEGVIPGDHRLSRVRPCVIPTVTQLEMLGFANRSTFGSGMQVVGP